jgi:hypothetical protein
LSSAGLPGELTPLQGEHRDQRACEGKRERIGLNGPPEPRGHIAAADARHPPDVAEIGRGQAGGDLQAECRNDHLDQGTDQCLAALEPVLAGFVCALRGHRAKTCSISTG